MHTLVPAQKNRHVTRYATTLARAGYDITLIDVAHDAEPEQQLEQEGIRLRHISLPRWTQPYYKSPAKLPWLLFKVTRIILGIFAVIGTRADVYHADDITALPACYLAAQLRRKPLVFDSHELPLVDERIVRQPIIHGVSVWLLRGMLPRCSALIVVSPPIAEEMQRMYGGTQGVVIRNVPTYQVIPTADRLRQALGLDGTTRIALYQGYIQPDRGLDLFVRVAKYLAPTIVLVLMGDGPSRDVLQRLIKHENVENRIKMLPAVPYAELLSWTTSADLGLIIYPPSTSLNVRYCLPNKLFEYLMAGVPVLASPLDAVAEVLRQYGVGQVVTSLDPAIVGEAINTMLSDPTSLAQMRSQALEAAREALNWEVESQRLVRLYGEIENARQKSK